MDHLKKTRKSVKQHITRIITWFTNNQDKEKRIFQFQTRVNDLISYFEKYNNVQDEIEELDTDGLDNEKRDDLEAKYYDFLSDFQQKIADLSGISLQLQSNVSQLNLSSQSQMSNVKLPEIKIPIFSGDFTEWTSFYELFSTLILNNTSLSSIQKFIYLKGYLRHEPLQLIDNLQLSDSNFNVALDILKKRYSNDFLIVNCHINNLLDVPNLTKINSQNLRDFLTHIHRQMECLKTFNIPVDQWDLLLIHIFCQKLDPNTRKSFEYERDRSRLPTMDDFSKFLQKKCEILETLQQSADISSSSKYKSQNKPNQTSHLGLANSQNNLSCFYCKRPNHSLSRCNAFVNLPHKEKLNFLQSDHRCSNCFGKHEFSQCRSTNLCNICHKKHHTSLHIGNTPLSNQNSQNSQGRDGYPESDSQNKGAIPRTNQYRPQYNKNKSDYDSRTSMSHTSFSQEPSLVLLSTAVVNIKTKNRQNVKARVLIDSGSQSSFITENLVKKLGLSSYNMLTNISVISGDNTTVNKMTDVNFSSCVEQNKNFKVSCLILKEITKRLPQVRINKYKLNIPQNVTLADPNFNIPSEIDMLLSAQLYRELIKPDIVDLGKNLPILQNTHLGYVVSGSVPNKVLSKSNLKNSNVSFFIQGSSELDNSNDDLNQLLPKFWQLEEVEINSKLSVEDIQCEKIFTDTTKVLENGQFQVNLPLKNENDFLKLGDSFSQANKRFSYLEKRFKNNSSLYNDYKNFIDEYVNLNQAKYISSQTSFLNQNRYFLPHHCVIRESSSTTKLRVVFDASMKTTSGLSLNDILLKGFKVQPDLFDILCRFRSAPYVFICDIEKMYRQVKVNPDQTFLQTILWKDNPESSLRQIELTTVTYGTNAAPYLATRCLVELANKNIDKFPQTCWQILNQCYLDDFLCFAYSESELQKLSTELMSLCNSANFNLHKWCSNSQNFLNSLHGKQSQMSYQINTENGLNKVLGISWSPSQDNFFISVPKNVPDTPMTKRKILSIIAQMFDPLGFIGPVILRAKIFMQEIWKSKIDWDDELPKNLLCQWKEFSSTFYQLSEVVIPRFLFCQTEFCQIDLFGFCDACQKGYGACLYARAVYKNNVVSCQLICSKSRVTPLKTVTLPRLELCGAVLLAKLCSKILSIFKDVLKFETVNLFTDSQIVLSWLNSDPSRWSTFVANRVAKVQELTSDSCTWYHVPSQHNPGDLISRGLNANEIKNCSLWWNGPQFLHESVLNLEKFKHVKGDTSVEQKTVKRVVNLHVLNESDLESLFFKFSSFTKLQRVLAYCLRFLNNVKLKNEKMSGFLTVKELQAALELILKFIQNKYFSKEILELKSKKNVTSKAVKSLKPFLDDNDFLRVGGRLSYADLPYEHKHPILLPSKNHIVNLLLTKEHLDLCHAGARTVLSNFRTRFWPLNGLREVKRIIHNCITCYRFRATNSQQIMANLPKERISIVRPFSNVGVDFGGPLLVKSSTLRRASLIKCYIAIFICMSTKAVHIELVSSLSTDAFLLTLKRFIARRGKPHTINSDNGTNFCGSKNRLKEIFEFFKNKNNSEIISNYLSSLEINWKFIPPRSPHWGGLWEAAVKSAKSHICRIVGNSHLTFEELTTVLSQIEAILNSRPLCALSEDPSDLECLTPGHFLIGTSLMSYPEKDLSNSPINRLSRWNHCVKLQQDFWKRWSTEYLNSLQKRTKWYFESNNIKQNDIVLLKEENVPPLIWPKARILEVIPGHDNKVRVVKLQTKDGVFTRPITKLCLLPISDNFQPDDVSSN